MQKVIAVVGPTASGKTGLSIKLAKEFGGEILSADSMQIYRQMNIGTAKPSLAEQNGIPHHLMGHIDVERTYNVASYVEDAREVLAKLEQKKRLAVICGGTGLYIDHLLGNTDFFDIPLVDGVRQKYEQMVQKQGNDAVYKLLQKVDPALAQRLHPNDIKRVIRGLEVLEITGRRLSDFQADSHRESPYDVLYIGLNYQKRELLYQRIDRRVDLMMEQGLLKEIDDLRQNHCLSATARAAIGYKEIIDALECGGSLDDAVALVKQKSRNYAKRQLTWFKKNQQIHWLYPDVESAEALFDQACVLVRRFLEGGCV
ncbi:MAG: tRNA (adenosine(37)-N6)-dimethylallyltransferase MiaA [Clostridia bacterium]|nr:tRNA (adenosine(37)-N6)-dimethylallyltransferase MiaA [Clostridia bacterium]